MERELPEELRQFFIEEEIEPVEIERAEFVSRCIGALDVLVEQHESTGKGINSIVNMLGRARMFEEDPDFNVTYLEMPNGSVSIAAEPITRKELGFNERK